jgi:hypothetical protein
VYAEPNVINILFLNNSGKFLSCDIQGKEGYTPFIRLPAGMSREFQGFARNSEVRCSTQTDNRASTMLTYFTVKVEGRYELIQAAVPCGSCTSSKTRLATIVVPPDGQSEYTRWK